MTAACSISSLLVPKLRRLTRFRASGCRSSSSSPSTLLSRWANVLSRVPPPDMSDPSTESSRQEDIYVKALLGDKISGLAVTTKLIEMANAPLDTGSLTKVIAATVSNNFLAKHAHKVLLPSWKKLNLESLSEWEVGSLVEMAVCAVHKLDPGAVDMLAM